MSLACNQSTSSKASLPQKAARVLMDGFAMRLCLLKEVKAIIETFTLNLPIYINPRGRLEITLIVWN